MVFIQKNKNEEIDLCRQLFDLVFEFFFAQLGETFKSAELAFVFIYFLFFEKKK